FPFPWTSASLSIFSLRNVIRPILPFTSPQTRFQSSFQLIRWYPLRRPYPRFWHVFTNSSTVSPRWTPPTATLWKSPNGGLITIKAAGFRSGEISWPKGTRKNAQIEHCACPQAHPSLVVFCDPAFFMDG